MLFQWVLVKLSAVQKTVKLLWVAYLSFYKPTIRYYGVYHPTVVNKLNLAREQFKQSPFIAVTLPTWQDILNKLGTTLTCPECGAQERIAAAPIKR
jgi:hypothetical protein